MAYGGATILDNPQEYESSLLDQRLERGALHALAESKMLLHRSDADGNQLTLPLTGLIYQAEDSNFAEEETPAPISALAQPHPPEIAMPLDRLRAKYPDSKKLGFLVMRFAAAKAAQRNAHAPYSKFRVAAALSPCGACRQVLAEFGECVVICADSRNLRRVRLHLLSELLPSRV